jgi:hypothetical protein
MPAKVISFSKSVTNLGPQVQHQHRKTASFQQQINLLPVLLIG